MSEMMSELQDSIRQVLNDQDIAAEEGAVWAQAVELGWLLVAVPEDLGGLGLGLEGACIVQRELGRRAATIPVLSVLLALDAVCNAELSDKEALIEKLVSGEYAALSLADGSVQASATDSGLQLTGSVSAMPSADTASHYLIWTEAHDCLALVKADSAGLTTDLRATWDLTRRLYDVQLENVAVDNNQILARGDDAVNAIRRLLTLRDFLFAADALGAAEGLLALTIEHLTVREQFGRPLAMFQALKHRCADLKSQTAAAEAMLQIALSQGGEPGSSAAELTGLKIKQFSCAAYAAVAEDSLQLHGGIGMASEHPCHLYLKRAMLSQHLGRQLDYSQEVARRALPDC